MIRLTIISILVTVVVGRTPRVRPIVPTLNERITGGEPTAIEQHPYQLSLQAWGSHFCGASIISPTRALTSAFCTNGSSASSLSVRAGSTYHDSGGQVVNVKSICQHPGYDKRIEDNDVSVLLLVSALSLGQSISLVNEGGALAPGTPATVSGWGALKTGSPFSSQLHKVEVPKVSQVDCKRAYGETPITENMICFGYLEGGKNTCTGDSGGPLVSGGVQVGIVSWGASCTSSSRPAIFTDIAASSIRNHIMDNC